jgi:hypothetical protein
MTKYKPRYFFGPRDKSRDDLFLELSMKQGMEGSLWWHAQGIAEELMALKLPRRRERKHPLFKQFLKVRRLSERYKMTTTEQAYYESERVKRWTLAAAEFAKENN